MDYPIITIAWRRARRALGAVLTTPARHVARSGLAVVFAATLAGTSAAPLMADEASALEYRVKAAFLFNFAKFVEWPAEKFSGAGTPIDICIIGDDPFGGVIDKTVAGKTINNRSLQVRRERNAASARDCHIAYVSESEERNFGAILQSLKSHSVLTVNEAEGFMDSGGMIRFTLVDRKVRFEINPSAAESEGLKVSSKLLKVASAVRK